MSSTVTLIFRTFFRIFLMIALVFISLFLVGYNPLPIVLNLIVFSIQNPIFLQLIVVLLLFGLVYHEFVRATNETQRIMQRP